MCYMRGCMLSNILICVCACVWVGVGCVVFGGGGEYLLTSLKSITSCIITEFIIALNSIL